MELFGRRLSDELVIVAELGVNHEGSLSKAKELLAALVTSGVDAVKLQSYTPERLTSRTDEARFDRVRRFALTEEEHNELFELAETLGLNLFSTAASEDWVPYLATKSRVLKVASGDITFKPTIQAGTELFDQIIISTGASTVEEIDQAVGWVSEASHVPLREKLVLLHCVSAYPAPAEEANLGAIKFMQERYGVVVGFSSHFLEDYVPIAAVAAGASVIEVHVTDERENREFRDHALSVEIHDLPDIMQNLRTVFSSIRWKHKEVQNSEIAFLQTGRKKGYLKQRAIENSALKLSDLFYARSHEGLQYPELEKRAGRKFSKRKNQGTYITEKDFSPEI